jgi:hypothetical protein
MARFKAICLGLALLGLLAAILFKHGEAFAR